MLFCFAFIFIFINKGSSYLEKKLFFLIYEYILFNLE